MNGIASAYTLAPELLRRQSLMIFDCAPGCHRMSFSCSWLLPFLEDDFSGILVDCRLPCSTLQHPCRLRMWLSIRYDVFLPTIAVCLPPIASTLKRITASWRSMAAPYSPLARCPALPTMAHDRKLVGPPSVGRGNARSSLMLGSSSAAAAASAPHALTFLMHRTSAACPGVNVFSLDTRLPAPLSVFSFRARPKSRLQP
mmetsp:Transcript_21858/g.54100  ORF Transcript_21858/g.54100 Transcript_21858/m.54100 type:complete len:200 (+) Transcript_21858:369-968(+)